MSRKKFSHLLEKYQRGECTQLEKKFVEYWFGLIEASPNEKDQHIDWQEVEDRMWASMQTKMQPEPIQYKRPVFLFSTIKWLSAACLILAASYLFLSGPKTGSWMSSRVKSESGWVVEENNTSSVKKVSLSDGSIVELSPNSKLKFPDRFDLKERVVHLTGNAFFSIHRDTKRPFYVRSGEIVTKVLGTSFYVETGTAARMPKVEVVTGTVAVYENPESGIKPATDIILTANKQATFNASEHKFTSSLVDLPRLIDPKMSPVRFQFRNSSLSDVVAILKDAYGIDIIIENKNMNSCTLTADLSGQPLFTQLDIICAAIAASYRLEATRIVIRGKGCSVNPA
ncbi:FecR family protein [Dyadobacter psychrotolerans]|uniref:FecR family protein n=1 Tax=Dyadobacter psychrotolerans TaxID=2541721 RepID=A0A4R5DWZ4_9BACT|nr:FecR family protein [Dyadobacter psychrotolerans]TDE15583.1 FecR family protein [Dyadobacter psychrotolerans]